MIDAEGNPRKCVECGFTDSRPVLSRDLPVTRVTRAAARRVETTSMPVRFLDD